MITDSIVKDNILNSYYMSSFSCDQNIPRIQSTYLGESFTVNTKIVRKRVAAVKRNKSLEPDSIPGEIL
jgi:hypothetical protein